jgi:hypothetical protein
MQTEMYELRSLLLQIRRRRAPTKRLRRQRSYLVVRLRFLTPASVDAAIGNARILLEALDTSGAAMSKAA